MSSVLSSTVGSVSVPGVVSGGRKKERGKRRKKGKRAAFLKTPQGRNELARNAVLAGEIDRPGEFLGLNFNPIERAPNRRTILGR